MWRSADEVLSAIDRSIDRCATRSPPRVSFHRVDRRREVRRDAISSFDRSNVRGDGAARAALLRARRCHRARASSIAREPANASRALPDAADRARGAASRRMSPSTTLLRARDLERALAEPWPNARCASALDDAMIDALKNRFAIMTPFARRGALCAAMLASKRATSARAIATWRDVAAGDADEWVRAMARAMDESGERFDCDRFAADVPVVRGRAMRGRGECDENSFGKAPWCE